MESRGNFPLSPFPYPLRNESDEKRKEQQKNLAKTKENIIKLT